MRVRILTKNSELVIYSCYVSWNWIRNERARGANQEQGNEHINTSHNCKKKDSCYDGTVRSICVHAIGFGYHWYDYNLKIGEKEFCDLRNMYCRRTWDQADKETCSMNCCWYTCIWYCHITWEVNFLSFSFFGSGLWGPKAYSLWGGVVPSPSIGYEYP